MSAIAMRIKGKKGLSDVQRGLAVLRKYGPGVHFWTAGTGWLNGVQAANYLDSAGTTAASVDNPIGLVLDQLSGQGPLGPELVPGALDFTTSAWTKSNGATAVSANVVTFPTAGTSEVLQTNGGQNSAGKSYWVTFTASGNGTLSCGVTNRTDLAVRQQFTLTGTPQTFTALITQNGTTSTNAGLSFFRASGDTCTQATIVVASWKQARGIPASQATTANKLMLRRGLVNQQVYSSVSSSIGVTYGWGITGTGTQPVITPNYGPDPWGGNTACRVQLSLNGGTSIGDRCYLSSTAAPIDSVTRTSMTWVRTVAGTATILTRLYGNPVYYTVDTNWQLVGSTGSSSVDATHTLVEIRGGQTTPNSNTADLLVATHGVFLGTVTPQQVMACGGIPLTTTTAASSQNGNFGWEGYADAKHLVLGSVPFQLSDDHTVIAGAATRSASQRVNAFSIRSNASVPPIVAELGFVNGCPQARWRNDASSQTLLQSATPNMGPAVLSLRAKSRLGELRVNGVQVVAPTALPASPATVTTAAIGAGYSSGNAVTDSMYGTIYSIIAVNVAISDSDLLDIERMVAVSTGPTGLTF